MLKSHPFLSLFFVSGLVSAGWACSSDTGDTTVKVPPGSGAGTSAGGSSSGGGGSATVPTAGSVAAGGSDSGQAGSQPVAGSVSMAGGTAAGAGGTGTAGAGGTGTGGTGGGGMGGGSGGASDAGKVVLFDGSDATFKSWKSIRPGGADNPWKLNADKTMTVNTNTGDIQTKQPFQDAFFHVEYMTPKITDAGGGQERGNSGIYLKGSWELQVLDTFGLAAAIDGCGAIYEVSKPLAVACYKGEEWNTYEIEFKAQVCVNGTKTVDAKVVEVKLNGVLVQQNVTLPANETRAGQKPSCDPKGLLLQDHSSILPVSYRNIWAIPRTQ